MIRTYVTPAGFGSAQAHNVASITAQEHDVRSVALNVYHKLDIQLAPEIGNLALVVYRRNPDLSTEGNPHFDELPDDAELIAAESLVGDEPERIAKATLIAERAVLEVVTSEWDESLTAAFVRSAVRARSDAIPAAPASHGTGSLVQRLRQGFSHHGKAPLNHGRIQTVAEDTARRYPHALHARYNETRRVRRGPLRPIGFPVT